MKNRIFVIVFILIFLGVSLSATQKHEAIINKITPNHLLAYKYPDDAKENFAIFEDKIQITGKDITISAAWAGHSITASNENVITFSLQSLDNSTPEVKSYISFYAYHADSSDQCAGSADKKTFKMKRIFNFKIRANSDLKNIKIPLKISDNDLKCEQCGRVLKHGNFLFYFELVDKGKITISPFELQTSFPVRIQSKTDENAEYLSNIVQDDYTPYPMKELPKQAVFSEDFGTLSQKLMATRKDFSEFQPVLEIYQKGNWLK